MYFTHVPRLTNFEDADENTKNYSALKKEKFGEKYINKILDIMKN